ncbi:HNH endonuclease [Pedobacter jeongneungensis]|uniref:HNH endonuclease n=1 Tax=Pedobacter jeongneungensis TaxID=947309 RepID=UPI00046AB510|nr:hypothetical protein [Pedobacter jeongneungensis]
MIHLPIKDRDLPPARLSVPGALRQICRAIEALDGEVYNASYYPHNEVVGLLRAYSIHKVELEPGDRPKCNYCESQIEHAVTLQVEHYRPKAKVEAGENDHIELPGYYWLGLEWTNLLLACPKCNGKDAKGSKFPIRGNRAPAHSPVEQHNNNNVLVRVNCYADVGPLQQEQAILLNPEIDHPELYLTFDLLGNIEGFGNDADRGEISKDTYRLNRDELVVCRQKVWNDLKNEINLCIAGHRMLELNEQALRYCFRNIANKLLIRKLPTEEYTLWGRFINDNLADFLQEIDNFYADIFREVYNGLLVVNP